MSAKRSNLSSSIRGNRRSSDNASSEIGCNHDSAGSDRIGRISNSSAFGPEGPMRNESPHYLLLRLSPLKQPRFSREPTENLLGSEKREAALVHFPASRSASAAIHPSGSGSEMMSVKSEITMQAALSVRRDVLEYRVGQRQRKACVLARHDWLSV